MIIESIIIGASLIVAGFLILVSASFKSAEGYKRKLYRNLDSVQKSYKGNKTAIVWIETIRAVVDNT
jgi:hypothetical protein